MTCNSLQGILAEWFTSNNSYGDRTYLDSDLSVGPMAACVELAGICAFVRLERTGANASANVPRARLAAAAPPRFRSGIHTSPLEAKSVLG